MRLFVVLSPLLSGRRPGDMLTGDQVAPGGDDAKLDRAVAAGFYTEVFYDAPPAAVDDVVDEHPPRNASRDDWAAYADARGVDVDGLGRDDIIKLFLSDGE